MGTQTITKNDNYVSSGASGGSWTLNITIGNIIITEETNGFGPNDGDSEAMQDLLDQLEGGLPDGDYSGSLSDEDLPDHQPPLPSTTVTAKYTASPRGQAIAIVGFYISDAPTYNASRHLALCYYTLPEGNNPNWISWAPNVTKTLTRHYWSGDIWGYGPAAEIEPDPPEDPEGWMIPITYDERFFYEGNKNTRTINLYLIHDTNYPYPERGGNVSLHSMYPSSPYYNSNYEGTILPSPATTVIATATLDAPPTFDATEVSINTPAPYAGKTTATVSVSNLSAKCGGDIASVVLTIGNQTSEPRTTDGNLTIDLDAVGDFTPIVTVTDSRGQTTTTQLLNIYVIPYICNVSMATVERINASTNKLEDEGTNALLKADFNYSQYTGSSLIAPVVKVNDTVTNNVTWYTSWNNTSGFSGAVSDWSSIIPGTTLYAKISDNFGISTSYTIDLYPQTTVQAASAESFVSLTLSQAFYLIAGKAGGHGLGIGKKPAENDLEVAMVSKFEDQVYVLDELKVYDDATYTKDILLNLVDWSLSGTTDYDIYEAVSDLGWASDVFVDDTIIHI